VEILTIGLTALLGSTGLAGLITAGVQWTRRARLRRRILHLLDLVTRIEAGAVEHTALNRAVRRESLELASLSLIPFPIPRYKLLITGAIGVASGTVFTWFTDPLMPTLSSEDRAQIFPEVALLTLAMSAVFAGWVDYIATGPRRAFVHEMLKLEEV